MVDNKTIYRATLIYAGLATLCLLVPWLLPVQEARSESYALGFSNKALIACILALFVGPVFILTKFVHGFSFDVSSNCNHKEEANEYAKTTKWIRNTSLIVFGVCISILLVNSQNLAGYGEAEYLLLRSVLVEAGKVPYVDFEYAYGPFFIYSLAFMKGLGISAGLSEVLLVTTESALGYFSIFYITGKLFGKNRSAGRLMYSALFLATCLFAITAGQNYSFFRFATALAVGCYILTKINKQYAEGYSLLSGLVFVLGWVVSPEVGIAAGMAFGVVTTLLSTRKLICAFGVAASVSIAIVSNPLILSSLETIFQFAKGGNNFPAFPSFHILLLLISICLSVVYIAKQSVNDDPIGWLVFVYSVGLLPGALGRCDPGHVIFYGFGFTILAGKYLVESKIFHQYFANYCIILGCGNLVLWLAMVGFGYSLTIAAVSAKTILPILPDRFRESVIEHIPTSYHEKALVYLRRNVTDSQSATIESDSYVLNPRSDLGSLKKVNIPYFVTLHNAATTNAFARLTADLSGKTVLLPYGFVDGYCKPWEVDYKTISVLFGFPTNWFKQKNHPEMISEDFCAQLRNAETISEGVAGGLTKLKIKASSG